MAESGIIELVQSPTSRFYRARIENFIVTILNRLCGDNHLQSLQAQVRITLSIKFKLTHVQVTTAVLYRLLQLDTIIMPNLRFLFSMSFLRNYGDILTLATAA